jgi:hypothetical protein
MIITIARPYGVIKGLLKKWKKISVVACNSCARACETGGKKSMEKLVEKLRNDGFEIVDEDVVPMACNVDFAKKGDYNGDMFVVMACDSGVATFQSLYRSKRIIAANKTIGLGSKDRHGNLFVTKKI